MCFLLRGKTHTLNLYWTVDYDVATGCDTVAQDVLRLINGRCLMQSPGQQCQDRFLAYERAVSERMPAEARRVHVHVV